MKVKLDESLIIIKRIPEYEARIRASADEIERLNVIVDKKNN